MPETGFQLNRSSVDRCGLSSFAIAGDTATIVVGLDSSRSVDKTLTLSENGLWRSPGIIVGVIGGLVDLMSSTVG